MTYHRETGQVSYRSKDGTKTEVLDALEWIAAMCSHVPNRGEQMVRYYGYYSNVARGKRKKQCADDHIPCMYLQVDVIHGDMTAKADRQVLGFDNRLRSLFRHLYSVLYNHKFCGHLILMVS